MISVCVVKSCQQQAACDYLLSLSTSKSLQPTIVSVLLDAVSDVADRLRRAAVADDDDLTSGLPPASQLENIGCLLDCVERVVTSAASHRGASDALQLQLRRRLSSHLDQSLRHIASAFPLFVYRIWHLGGVIDNCLSPTTTD